MNEESNSNIPRAVVHVDLDGTSDIFACHGLTWRPDEDPIFNTGLPACLQFFEREKIKATLFAIARDLQNPNKLDLLRQAVALGHEIASHSMTHANLSEATYLQKRNEIFDSKKALEDSLGTEIRGFRAPSYQIDRESFELLCEAGYSYDSSVYPTGRYARRLHVPAVLGGPFRPLLDSDVLEIPMPDHGAAPFPFHPSYTQLLGKWYGKWRLRAFRKTNQPLIFLFHAADFAVPLPARDLPSIKARIYTQSHLSQRAKIVHCEEMIRSVRQHYRLSTTRELLGDAENARRRDLVLGISTTHETGSALFDGHECLAAISEERLDRVKFSTQYPPKKSIQEVVNIAGIDPRRITDVVVAGISSRPLLRQFLRNQWQDTKDYHGWIDYFPHFNKLPYRLFAWFRSLGYPRVLKFMRKTYGISPRIHYVAHHLCHAASVYRTAPFDDSLVVTADGVGDYTSLTVSYGTRGQLRLLHLIGYPHSLGQFYTACTQVLGFRANRHEGKITGLSGFGKADPELYGKVKSTIKQSGPGFKLDKRFYSEGIVRGLSLRKFRGGEDLFESFQYRNYKSPLKRLLNGYDRQDVACVFQTLLEEELVEIVRPFAEKTGAKHLCLSGGIFANVKANAAIFHSLKFDNVYIYPHMGDGGLGPGAALELLQAKPKPFNDVYWGPSYAESEIVTALEGVNGGGLKYERMDNVALVVARLLSQKKVIARFDGRMEFGPRALCNRSILYSAGDHEANDWLNKRLGRTEFMPFAPVVMEEHAPQLFRKMTGTEHACKFMTIILECTDWMKENCPAVVHVDGTARPQIVNEAINPGMYRILKEYHSITGIPVLVNTSFNMHEEPIVCSPEDAIRAYLASRLDGLAIGTFLARIDHGVEGGHTRNAIIDMHDVA